MKKKVLALVLSATVLNVSTLSLAQNSTSFSIANSSNIFDSQKTSTTGENVLSIKGKHFSNLNFNKTIVHQMSELTDAELNEQEGDYGTLIVVTFIAGSFLAWVGVEVYCRFSSTC